MLTRLLPEQISNFWDVIKYAIEQSLPPIAHEHPDRINRILISALAGKIDIWVTYTTVDDSVKLEGVAVTRITYDDVSDTRSLLLYCIYGYEPLNKSSWTSGLEILAKYARSKGCSFVVAYTELPYVVEISRRLGADVRYTFISFDVNESVQNLNKLQQRAE